jgi:acyl dehydratase
MTVHSAGFVVGTRVEYAHTVTERDVLQFAGITGDFAPHHVDEEYSGRTRFGRRVAHGALIVGFMSAASTELLRTVDAHLVSLGYDRVRFLAPVFLGDRITVAYEITGYDTERARTTAKVEVQNQDGLLVAVATHLMKVVDD